MNLRVSFTKRNAGLVHVGIFNVTEVDLEDSHEVTEVHKLLRGTCSKEWHKI